MKDVVGKWQDDMWFLAWLDDTLSEMSSVPEDIYLYDNAELTEFLNQRGLQ